MGRIEDGEVGEKKLVFLSAQLKGPFLCDGEAGFVRNFHLSIND